MNNSSRPSTKASSAFSWKKALVKVGSLGALESLLAVAAILLCKSLSRDGIAAVMKLSRTLAILKRQDRPRGRNRGSVASCAAGGASHATFRSALDAVRRGEPVVVVDSKGDLCLLTELLQVVRERTLGGAWLEQLQALLLTGGDEHDIAEAMLPEALFSSRHDLSRARQYVVYEVRVLRARGLVLDVDALDRFFDPRNLRVPLGYLPESEFRREVELYLDSLTGSDEAILKAVLSTLRTLHS